MKSWSKLPSFLVRVRILAFSMTSLRSATSSWPSSESVFGGDARTFEERAEFNATSICLFDGTLPLANAGRLLVSRTLNSTSRCSRMRRKYN